MKRRVIFCLLPAAAIMLYGQEAAPDRINVPVTDASRPVTVRASLLNGGITVRAHSGREVIVESRTRGSRQRRAPAAAGGLKRIDNTSGSLDIEEENNVVKISGGMNRSLDLTVLVPANSNVKLSATNDGDIVVEGISGEIDITNLNGDITAKSVSGWVSANTLNGKVLVTMDRVTPDKPMAFSSLNGTIDVTLPGDTKGRLKMKSDNGDIWTDFDLKMEASKPPATEESRAKGAKFRIKLDKAMYASINGGGPEMRFETYNGNVYIRKKQ